MNDTTYSTQRSPQELENAIEHTRDRLDDTVDRLIDALSPSHFVDQLTSKFGLGSGSNGDGKAKAKEACRRAYRSVAQQVRTHPGPTLMLGAGLVWMMLDDDEEPFSGDSDPAHQRLPSGASATPSHGNRIVSDPSFIGTRTKDRSALENGDNDGDDASIGNRISDMADSVTDRVKSAARSGLDSVKGAAESTGETAATWRSEAAARSKRVSQRVSSKVKHGCQASGERYEEAMEEHPLAVAAGALALGLLGALALPRTRTEDKLVGEQSDKALETAKERGKEVTESAKAVAQRAQERALDEAEEKGLTVDSAREKGREFASQIGEIASSAKEEAEQAADEELAKRE